MGLDLTGSENWTIYTKESKYFDSWKEEFTKNSKEISKYVGDYLVDPHYEVSKGYPKQKKGDVKIVKLERLVHTSKGYEHEMMGFREYLWIKVSPEKNKD